MHCIPAQNHWCAIFCAGRSYFLCRSQLFFVQVAATQTPLSRGEMFGWLVGGTEKSDTSPARWQNHDLHWEDHHDDFGGDHEGGHDDFEGDHDNFCPQVLEKGGSWRNGARLSGTPEFLHLNSFTNRKARTFHSDWKISGQILNLKHFDHRQAIPALWRGP